MSMMKKERKMRRLPEISEKEFILEQLGDKFEEMILQKKVQDRIEEWLWHQIKEEYLSGNYPTLDIEELFFNIGIDLSNKL